MKLIANLTINTLTLDSAVYRISCNVRSLANGRRASHEVVLSVPDTLPYDPQPFPPGVWNVTGIQWREEKLFDYQTYGPVKIVTDAWRMVNVWELDDNGDYARETERQVKDSGYLIHYSEYGTTLGCIRVTSPQDVIAIARLIAAALEKKESVQLEVI